MRHAVLVLKLLVVPAGLAWLGAQIADDPRLGLLHMHAGLLVAALAVNQAALTLFAVRMQLGLRAFGIALPLLQALRVHLQSMFYFFALPMTVGLEVARFAKIRKAVGEAVPTANLTYALLADRLLGACAAAALAVALLPFVRFDGMARWEDAGRILAWAAAVATVLGLVAAHGRIRRHLAELLQMVRSGRRGLAAAFAVALVTHVLFAAGIYLAARAANVPITFVQTLFAISAAMLFVVIPVSFAGVSAVEGAGLGVLVGLGLSLEEAAIVVVLSYLAKVVAAFEGGAWEVAEGGGKFSRLLASRTRPDP